MNNFITCFFALVACIPTAFAGSGSISRAVPTAGSGAQSKVSAPSAKVSRTATSRTPVRTVSTSNVADDASVASRTVVSRSVVVPAATGAARSTVTSRNSATRSALGKVSDNLNTAVNASGRNARVTDASMNSNPILRRAGITVRPTTAEVGGRAKIAGTDIQTGSNVSDAVRDVQSRNAVVTRESIVQAKERLEQTAQLNSSCQQQYNDCMDQFCAVIDTNQGRCSCSANLSNYSKVEQAVKDANTQLNDVAQRIRYVGLSADEIRAIMTETEAEEVLSGTVDTSETRNMLEEIEKLIKDPTSATTNTSYSSSTSFGLDMDLDFSDESADIFSLDFLNSDSNSSFSNLRGTALYSAAKKRCNSVLNQCKEAGGDSKQITGNYDLAIDKDCIAYEKGLQKMNETLVSNVRSANRMLQKARLAVLQNKNEYDAKACVSALNTCMMDDMVCGDNYYKCIDPTKRYIDENGDVVLGKNITLITEFMTNYNNASIDANFLKGSVSLPLTTEQCKSGAPDSDVPVGNMGACTVRYLLEKIGTGQKVTDNGLCRAVLDKCQRYTYDSKGKYMPYNDVVINYIQRAMVNIKAAQQKIIHEYSSSCMLDVAACYNTQVSQVNAWSANASVGSVQSVMRGACRNVALTCGYALFAGPPDLYDAGAAVCETANEKNCDGTDAEDYQCNNAYIDCVSDMFYQSLLCPDNSEYTSTGCKRGSDGELPIGCVNERCRCASGYDGLAGSCVASCGDFMTRNSYGTCVCVTGAIKDAEDAASCVCNTAAGYKVDDTGKACEQKTCSGRLEKLVGGECKCVDNATRIDGDTNGDCQCKVGYTENSTKDACQPNSSGT